MVHVIPWPDYLANKAAKLNVQASDPAPEPEAAKPKRTRKKASAEAEGE